MSLKNTFSTLKKQTSNLYAKVGVVATVATVSGVASAEESANIFKPLIDQIDVDPIKTGILSVAGLTIGIKLLVMGINKVRSMMK